MSPEHPGDDALSALLDGEATVEEAAHVEGCARCTARADELRHAAALIGGPVAVDGERREAAIAAALGARVISLEHRRRRQPPAWILAAAVVVLALGLLPLLGRDRGGDDQDTAASGRQELAEGADSDESSRAEDSAALESGTTFMPSAPVEAGDLGPLGADEIERRVTAELRASAGRESSSSTGDPADGAGATRSTPPCEAALRARDSEAGTLRLTARAVVDGRAVALLAFEIPGADGVALRVYVVGEGDCGDVLPAVSFPLP